MEVKFTKAQKEAIRIISVHKGSYVVYGSTKARQRIINAHGIEVANIYKSVMDALIEKGVLFKDQKEPRSLIFDRGMYKVTPEYEKKLWGL